MSGFSIDVKEQSDEDEKAGTILSQTPEVGEEVIPSEVTIEFTVSSGPKLEKIENLVGKSKSQVDEYVSSNGFIPNESEQYSNEIPIGHLISQSPEVGTEVVPKDTTIKLVYSLGPEPEPPKKVERTVEIPYEPEEEGQELEVKISIDDAEHSISEIYESFNITGPQTKRLEFTIAPDDSAFYQITIDNKVVTSETIPYPEE
jgi:serine/threonine-protein kinase